MENGGTRTAAPGASRGIICNRINRRSNIDVKNTIIPVVADGASVLVCCQHASDQRERAKRNCAEAHKAMERHVPPIVADGAVVLVCCQHASDQRERAKRNCAEAHKAMERHVPPIVADGAVVLEQRTNATLRVAQTNIRIPLLRGGC